MLLCVTWNRDSITRRPWARRAAAGALFAAVAAPTNRAVAEGSAAQTPPESKVARPAQDDGKGPPANGELRDPTVGPPDPHRSYLQYGLAFTIEDVVAPGPICPAKPCILGSGGGIDVRVGVRPTERFYIGGAYELSKQEPDKLYLLGILQQARGEIRTYFPTGSRTTPFVLAGAGVAGYGDEWAIDTWGPLAELGAGLEVQLSGGSLFAISMLYRPIYLRSFIDSSTITHGAGVAQFFTLELAVEAQDAL
jgi:hypothetical protein